MKLAPLALLLVCAPAAADVAVPQARTWRDGCAARIDEVAKKLGLPQRARTSTLPLLREDGAANPLQYVEYATSSFKLSVGQESDARPDLAWWRSEDGSVLFRRLHQRFAKIEEDDDRIALRFRAALDDCLKMGESK